jgi:signal transduction histidine kinase
MPDPLWYRSLYWRVAFGFIALLTVLILFQSLLFIWMAGRTGGTFPASSNTRLAVLVASDVRDQLERDPNVDVRGYVMEEYGRTAQVFIVLLADGRAFSNHGVMPRGLLRTSRLRFDRMMAAGAPGPLPGERQLPADRPDFAPIRTGDALVGLVAVPPGRAPVMGVFRAMAPTLLLSGFVVLVVGTAVAAVFVFRPVQRRLGELGDAARRIGAGDVAARAPEGDGDEVTLLAKNFNQMAAELQARAAALDASNRARRQLLADVSHELMTPLTAMRGYIETLRMAERRLDPETRERYLRIVDEETRQLETIVGDLLDLARYEDAGTPIARAPVSIAALFERVAGRHARELAERGVELTRRVDPSVAHMPGDADRLEQVLQNLTANALRHTPDGGLISLSASPGAGGVRITVRDTGAGIAAQHLPHVFDRFFKVDAARAIGGSGLGLSIVKAIVEGHGGTVAARNDGGAVFEIDLPSRSA